MNVEALSFLLLIVTLAMGDVKVSDLVFWKKADVSAYHKYFPSRLLEEERLTNEMAVKAVQNMSDGLATSLGRLVTYQAQELDTAQLMFEGTSAQGCVQGIKDFMPKAILEASSKYFDCTGDTLPSLERLNKNWERTNSSYQTTFQRALAGMDTCAKTYPNKDSLSRLNTCLQLWNNRYFSALGMTRHDGKLSPSMKVFTDIVATCGETAANEVVAKGWDFLNKLVHCARLSENVEEASYEAQVTSGFSNYLTRNDLNDQVTRAQDVNNQQIAAIEAEMLRYYDIQKRTLEKYVIESRDHGYYSSQVWQSLQPYFSIVSAASRDNPSSSDCVNAANMVLNNLVDEGSSAALKCDQNIVEITKSKISQVNNDFSDVNDVMPSVGNAAILSCFSQGYIFAENTIGNCHALAAADFAANVKEVQDSILQDVSLLQGYETSFFANSSSLPCGEAILRKAFLGANRVLYSLERCFYAETGTKYPLSIPPPSTPM